MKLFFSTLFLITLSFLSIQKTRDFGVEFGVMRSGKLNSITDILGVLVSHKTIIEWKNIRAGITTIIEHNGNIFQDEMPTAIYIGKGFGKLAGISQVQELGNIKTLIILTNILSVLMELQATIKYTLTLERNEPIGSVNGECCRRRKQC